MAKILSTVRIDVPSKPELEAYLKEIMADFADEEGEFTDDSVIEIRDILTDYITDNLSVEVF